MRLLHAAQDPVKPDTPFLAVAEDGTGRGVGVAWYSVAHLNLLCSAEDIHHERLGLTNICDWFRKSCRTYLKQVTHTHFLE